MKRKDWKTKAILVGILMITSDLIVTRGTANGCALRYKQHVDDKPNIFVTTNTNPGICRVQHEDNSSLNYHNERKYPEEIRPESVIGGLNYDARNHTLLYWSKIANVDHARLYKLRLNDSQWEAVLSQDDDFRDMSYDWVSKNLYIIMGSRSMMVAVNVEHSWNPTVILYDRSQMTSLAVHPNKGYLFFVETNYWYGVQHKIYRAHLDGSNVSELFNRTGTDVRYYVASIVVDFYSDRIYWSVPATDKIQSASLDGRDVQTISGVKVYSGQLDLSSRTLAVDKHYVYYRSAEANTVRRIEKTSETKDPDYELINEETAPITEILAFTYKSQKVRKDHPCKDGTAGCEKYCVAVPLNNSLKRICKCGFNEVLADDNVTCERTRHSVGSA
ncbi:low-density lipoprotein receptor-related protein 2-like [Phymastichus coffea]|uniref:low-density lipoprotein receptor-related protein 2-like n=1 Tax=Phymastichus coffea TaxID=108790 RepID=UPI00273CB5B1|nr:low-density lipoprotein receptor-related protein 2-like [Phymastichus coffea]